MTDIHGVPETILPGIWRVRLGRPEPVTPVGLFAHEPSTAGLGALPPVGECPLAEGEMAGEETSRGLLLRIPLRETEQVFGLGLQLLSFNQRGKKKTLRVNSDPRADTGDSHAPVPFFVTTRGYGVLVDTLRSLTINCGAAIRKPVAGVRQPAPEITMEIPRAAGVDLYVFGGPTMREAVQRYNLFSGGGCMPPLWGLGVWYRCKVECASQDVIDRVDRLHGDGIPCDVLGLEPGWQSHSYSCSHTWSERFPDPARTVSELAARNVRLNLWTHAFTHASSPLHEKLEGRSGDYLVWDGLVPDLADPEARSLFGTFYGATHLVHGVSGYKLDECDNSDFIEKPWSFPEFSRFPSGLDGEQMHSAFGTLFQKAVQPGFDELNRRTYGEIRSAFALAASIPYVLYSDLYDHASFIRGVATSGFCGLLWTPEVRHAVSAEDLIRRVQSLVFSPQAVINGWYISNPPWEQWEVEANNAGRKHPDHRWVTGICRDMLRLRMRFLPYLYAAFVDYHRTGMPPFRALVMDDPADEKLWTVDLQYMLGDRVLVAPVVMGEQARDVYLPRGGWRDFWTGRFFQGGQNHRVAVPIDRIPVFVRDDSILPLAEPALHTGDPLLRRLSFNVYGSGARGITLYEDDGESLAYRSGAVNTVQLAWHERLGRVELHRSGQAPVPGYVAGDSVRFRS